MRGVVLAALLLGGCGMGEGAPTVIDGSSAAAFKASVEDARGELGPRDRIKFEAASTALRGKQFAAAGDRLEYERRIREAMDGRTAPEIVAGVDGWTRRAGDDAADAVFDAKRKLQGGK